MKQFRKRYDFTSLIDRATAESYVDDDSAVLRETKMPSYVLDVKESDASTSASSSSSSRHKIRPVALRKLSVESLHRFAKSLTPGTNFFRVWKGLRLQNCTEKLNVHSDINVSLFKVCPDACAAEDSEFDVGCAVVKFGLPLNEDGLLASTSSTVSSLTKHEIELHRDITRNMAKIGPHITQYLFHYDDPENGRFLFMEHVRGVPTTKHGTLNCFRQLLNVVGRRNKLVDMVVFQVLFTLIVLRKLYPNFRHNQLTADNIMIDRWDLANYTYKVGSTCFQFLKVPVCAKITNFAKATTSEPLFHGPGASAISDIRVLMKDVYKFDDKTLDDDALSEEGLRFIYESYIVDSTDCPADFTDSLSPRTDKVNRSMALVLQRLKVSS